MSEEHEYLDVEDLLDLAQRVLGEAPALRDVGLLASAAARPRATAYGEDAYPDLWSKAAALLESVVGNHALVDGNKRLGWIATAVFLELNSVDAHRTDNDTVYDLVIAVAAGDLDVQEIAQALSGVCPRGRP